MVMKRPMKMHNKTHIALSKKNWGKVIKIKGKKYDKPMIDAAKYGARADGVISMADADLLLKAARPTKDLRASYDKLEKSTMAYIRKNFKFTNAADKKLRSGIAKLAAMQAVATKKKKAAEAAAKAKAMKRPMKMHSKTHIALGKKNWGKTVTIKGKKYDKPMIDAAKYGARGDGVISMADADLILKAARPTKDLRASYDKIEKFTMAYIRKNYKFTDAANKKLRAGIAKLAAKQAVATKKKKAA